MLDTEDVIRFGSSIIGHLLGLAKFEDQWPFDCRMMPRLGPGLSIFLWPSFRKDTRPGPGPLLRAKRNPPLQLEASRLQGPKGLKELRKRIPPGILEIRYATATGDLLIYRIEQDW